MKFVCLLTGSILLLIGAAFPCYAQAPVVALRNDLISPSPNAVSLGKFGIVPVSLYTGIPDVSIPLGEAAGKEISVPISINYHHNGLKSYELASWVGLGWTLNAGGAITRIIKDKLDETTAATYKYENNISKYDVNNVDQAFLDGSMFSGTFDTEPDLFVFNFGSYSGKFMIYKGLFYQFPYQKLKISGNPSSGFVIVTPEGTIYNFNETETTQPKGNANASYTVPTYISSWFLSTVKPADQKEVITFNYGESGTPISMHSPASQTYQKFESGYSGNSILSDKKTPLPSFVSTKRLTSISTSKMTVNFISQSTARTDITGDYALDQVSFSSVSGTLKTYKFNYGYFGEGSTITTLRLQSVDEKDNNSTAATAKRHTFIYNDSSNWPAQTDAVDHWGYSNGANTTGGVIIPNTLVSNGMDREPHAAYSSKGMLRKIIYPTGGSSVFTFEPNIYAPTRQYRVDGKSASNFINRSSAVDNTLLSNTTTFTLTSAQTIGITISRTPKDPVQATSPNGPDDPTKDVEPEITIDAGSVSKVASAAATTAAAAATSYKIVYNRDNGGFNATASLAAGTYVVTLYCDSKELGTAFNIGYVNQTTIPIEGIAGPGLRVKEIDSYTSADETVAPLLKKTYSYVDAQGFSTCRLAKGADYGGRPYTIRTYNGTNLVETNYTSYSSFINSALGDLIDQDFYYFLVNEYQVSATTDLRSQHEFTSTNNYTIYSGTGVTPTRQTDYKKVGTAYQPVLKHDYVYTTVAGETTFFSALKPYQTLLKVPSGGNGFADPLREYSYDWYSLTPTIWNYLASEKETSYTGTNGTDSLVRNKTYMIDRSSKLNLVGIKTNDSRGQERITRYKYPEDYDPTLTQAFLDHHVLSPVLEQQMWLKRSATDSVLLFGKVDDYDLTLFKPKTSYLLALSKPVTGPNQETKNALGQYTSLLSDSQYKMRILNSYDATTGNLVSQDLLGRASSKQVNYIWGYKTTLSTNLYPIAQCSNGALTDFFYTGFEDGGTNVVAGVSHTGVNYYNSNYALAFTIPNAALVYAYSYWYRSGAVWKYSGELTYTGPVTLTGEAFDDIRVYPVNGQMTTYTYFPEIGISSSTDGKGQTSYFEYDSFQRLKVVKDQNSNIVKSYDYYSPIQNSSGDVPVTCSGDDRKLVNGVCQQGNKFYDTSVYNSAAKNYTCTYHYEWTDGTRSSTFTETSQSACSIN